MADGLSRLYQAATGEKLATRPLRYTHARAPFAEIIHQPSPIEMGHARDSLLMGDYYGASALGDLLGDVIGDDDDDMGDLMGEEMGRRMKRLNRKLKRHGLVALPKKELQRAAMEQAQATAQAQQAAGMQSALSGVPMTAAGGKLATSGQRELMLPFPTLILAAALGSTGVLSTNVQRAIQLRRLLMTAVDNTAFTDAQLTVGISLIKIGADVVFNANGVVPLAAFAPNAWGVDLLTQPAQTGNLVEITLVRTVGVANTTTVSGTGIGASAGSR